MSRASVVDGLERLIERKSELARRAAAAPIAQRLQELRTWQAARLAGTYSDLRVDALTGKALSFFMSDLYGPQDLTRRDHDVARAWRLLKRALTPRMLEILSMAMELDVLSAELDLEMAERLLPGPLTAETYAQAYRAAGRPEARLRQIELVVAIGTALVRAVRTPLVRLALRAAHGPAHLAGFGTLQDFLERGFAAFERLPHPKGLFMTIERREARLMDILLAGGTISAEGSSASKSASG
ncbi:MAG: hypothetical protein KGL45_11315 [Gammaproteobacteria bacterium]|nr:hypothetical protein [Gammaproteobacteria bacterium]MDE2263103.1 hypothetical protein [Gammaproteobacteria bacterium]